MTVRFWVRKLFARPSARPAARTRRRLELEALEDRVVPATLTVNSITDNTTSDSFLTLREAVRLVNAGGDATAALGRSLTAEEQAQVSTASAWGSNDTVTFADSLAGQTISLSLVGDGTAGPSALGITSPMTLAGLTGDSGVTIAGGGASSNLRAFYVSPTGSLTLQDLTIANFRHRGGNGNGSGGGAAGMGGAVFNQGTLTLWRATVSDNTAQGGDVSGSGTFGGGGLGGDGSHFDGGGPNGGSFSSGGFGGGGGLTGNGGFGGGGGGANSPGFGGFGGGGGGGADYGAAGGFGGGAGANFFRAPGGGGAGMGGAIFNNGGTVSIADSTFSGNTATGGTGANNGQGLGGAVFNRDGTLTLSGSTFSGNTAANGGRQVYSLGDGSHAGGDPVTGNTATATITNSILGQADTAVTDFVAHSINGGSSTAIGSHNLIRSHSGYTGTVVSTADPLLGTLAANGGPTKTIALVPGSLAIDAGNTALVPAGVIADQRGLSRIHGDAVDIGAFEVQTVTPTFNALDSQTIVYGTATTTLTGHLGIGTAYPTGASVSVTLNAVTQTATVDAGGNFTTTFDTATLGVAGGPYTVTYTFAGNADFDPATDTSTAVTVTKAPSFTTTVGAGPFTYDGKVHAGGSGTVTGAGGLSTTATSLTYDGDRVNAGTYYVTAHYAGDSNHEASDGAAVAITIRKAALTGDAVTQDALNLAKQGLLTITLSNVAGLVNGDTLASVLGTAEFYLTVGANRYVFVPTAVTTTGSSVTITYSLKNSALTASLAAELADNTSAATAVSAGFFMESLNYTLADDYLARLFSTSK